MSHHHLNESHVPTSHHDVIVVGAGFAGIYSVHKFRDQLGLDVRVFDAADDVGGTWYWNRYPGARVDIEGVTYSYSFDAKLQQEWHWTERFPAQPEILRYLQHVADRFDIRRSVQFGTRITAVTWDDDSSLWHVTTDKGSHHTARYFVAGSGSLSVAKEPEFPGVETFAGRVLMTSNWLEDVDLTGKRVGVIGTGSSGIQVISEAAKVAKSLTVLQRTPNYATPLRNYPTDPQEEAAEKAIYPELRKASRNHVSGMTYSDMQPSALAVTPEQRRAVFDDRWKRGGFRLLRDSFADILLDQEANDTVAEYVRERIRERVEDPATAELLIPRNHPYGLKRPPMETDYYDIFNRSSVSLVDISNNPIETVVPAGVRLADGAVHEFDVLIFATGFDALTGPLLAMNITGRNGIRLADEWKDGPQTYLGLTAHKFPNLFMITGPQSPAVNYTVPLAIEDHVDFIAEMITYMNRHGYRIFEASRQAQRQWVAETTTIAERSLLHKSDSSASSWFLGTNVPGKPRKVLIYMGGVPRYRAICSNVQRNDYRGFSFAATSRELEAAGHTPALDPAVMFLDEVRRQQGDSSLREAGVEGARARVASYIKMQAPAKDVAKVSEHAYGDEPEQKLRIYVPDTTTSAASVVLYLHGGGFVCGDLEVVDEPARDLASRTGAIVVAATYRRAPEHRFPAAHDDACAALRWTVQNIGTHGGDPARLLLAGDSVGGNLATWAALQARTEGVDIAALVLIYPLINALIETPSRNEFASGPVIGHEDLRWFIDQYLSNPEDRTDPRLALDTADLDGLPPTMIITNECDPLRDEAEQFAEKLRAKGVDAAVTRFDGLAHGIFWLSLAVPRSDEQRIAVANFLITHLATSHHQNVPEAAMQRELLLADTEPS